MIKTLQESYDFQSWTIAHSENETYLWTGQPILNTFIYFDVCAVEEVFEARRLSEKFETMARCSYQHVFGLGMQKGYCNKCGWMQSMTEKP